MGQLDGVCHQGHKVTLRNTQPARAFVIFRAPRGTCLFVFGPQTDTTTRAAICRLCGLTGSPGRWVSACNGNLAQPSQGFRAGYATITHRMRTCPCLRKMGTGRSHRVPMTKNTPFSEQQETDLPSPSIFFRRNRTFSPFNPSFKYACPIASEGAFALRPDSSCPARPGRRPGCAGTTPP